MQGLKPTLPCPQHPQWARDTNTLLPSDALLAFHLFCPTPPAGIQGQQPQPVLKTDEPTSYFACLPPPCQANLLSSLFLSALCRSPLSLYTKWFRQGRTRASPWLSKETPANVGKQSSQWNCCWFQGLDLLQHWQHTGKGPLPADRLQ